MYLFIADNISISMYVMRVILCLFSALSLSIGTLQISIIIIIGSFFVAALLQMKIHLFVLACFVRQNGVGRICLHLLLVVLAQVEGDTVTFSFEMRSGREHNTPDKAMWGFLCTVRAQVSTPRSLHTVRHRTATLYQQPSVPRVFEVRSIECQGA